jgi:hypothetical protein
MPSEIIYLRWCEPYIRRLWPSEVVPFTVVTQWFGSFFKTTQFFYSEVVHEIQFFYCSEPYLEVVPFTVGNQT